MLVDALGHVSRIIASLDAVFRVEHQSRTALKRERVLSMALNEFGTIRRVLVIAVGHLFAKLSQFASGSLGFRSRRQSATERFVVSMNTSPSDVVVDVFVIGANSRLGHSANAFGVFSFAFSQRHK